MRDAISCNATSDREKEQVGMANENKIKSRFFADQFDDDVISCLVIPTPLDLILEILMSLQLLLLLLFLTHSFSLPMAVSIVLYGLCLKEVVMFLDFL
jgi:hypothetical protein